MPRSSWRCTGGNARARRTALDGTAKHTPRPAVPNVVPASERPVPGLPEIQQEPVAWSPDESSPSFAVDLKELFKPLGAMNIGRRPVYVRNQGFGSWSRGFCAKNLFGLEKSLRRLSPLVALLLALLGAGAVFVAGCTVLNRTGEPSGQLPLRETLSISPSRPQLGLNETLTLHASPVLQGQRVEHPVSWVSSEPDVISVSAGVGMVAVIRAVTLGRARITATTANGLTGFVIARVR